MTANDPPKARRNPSPSPRTRKRADRRFPGRDTSGINRIINSLADRLPEVLSPRAKRIVIFSAIVGSALCALFVVGILVVGITDRYDQFWTIIAAEILIVGVVTVASVLFTLVSHGK